MALSALQRAAQKEREEEEKKKQQEAKKTSSESSKSSNTKTDTTKTATKADSSYVSTTLSPLQRAAQMERVANPGTYKQVSGVTPTVSATAQNQQEDRMGLWDALTSEDFMPDSWSDFGKGLAYNAERIGAAALGFGEGITDFLGTTLYKGLEGVSSLGGLAPNRVSEWAGNAADKFLENSVTQDYEESIRQRYNPSAADETLSGVNQTLADVMLSIATGKGAASLLGKGVGIVDDAADALKAANWGKATFGTSAAGKYTGEAYNEGATTGQALAYGASGGMMEVLLESVSGIVPGFGKGKLDDVVRKVASSPAVQRIVGIVGEGGEEAAAEIISPFLKRAIYDPNAAMATTDEIVESAIMGMVSAGLLQTGFELPAYISYAADARAERNRAIDLAGSEFRQMGDDMVQAVVEEGLASDPSTKSYQQAAAIQQKLATGQTVTDREIGQLYQENVRAISAEEQNAAASATAQRVSDHFAQYDTTPTQQQNARRAPANANYGSAGMETFRSIVETSGMDPEQVQTYFQRPYELGAMDTPREKVTFESSVQEEAYNAGRLDRIASMKKAKTRGVTVYGDKAGLVENEFTKDMSNATFSLINDVSKALGMKTVMKERIVAGSGEANASMGEDGVFTLAKNANKPNVVLVAHEGTHRMQQLAPQEYRAFRDFAVQMASKGRPAEAGTLVEAYQARAAKQDVYWDTETAMDEIAAEFAEQMLGDEQKLREVISEAQKSESSRRGVEKFFEVVRDMIRKLKNLLPKYRNDAKAKAALQESISDLERAEKLWRDAFKAAERRVKQETAKQQTAKSGNVAASLKTTVDGDAEIITDRNGEPVAMIQKDGSSQFSLKTYDEGGRSYLQFWMDKRVKEGKIDKEDAADIVRQMDEYYDLCQKFTDKYAPFGAWSNASVVTDNKGKPVFSVVKANGEYAMNLDFSLVCKKRRTLDAVFGEMIKRGMMDNVDLAEADIARINDIIREFGFETACALCFVDAKRYRQAKVADTFVTQYNDMVRLLIPEGSDVRAHHFDFVESGNYKDSGRGLHTLSDAELKEGYAKLRQIMRENGSKTVPHKIAKHLLAVKKDRKLVSRSEFMNTDGFGAVKLKNPSVLKLYNSSKGSGGPKAAFSDVQYLGDILKKNNFTPARAYAVGGVRIQSFSDYIPRLVFDYLQMTADLAAKKLPAHAYTKEAAFAKQFGMTGIKINMSLVPAIDKNGIAPGLDANGDYFWFDGQSFGSDVGVKGSGKTGFDLAVKIQNASGYSQNCGTIAVGVSDPHIWKMLDDPDIRMIIPYHKSSLNHIVAMMNNIDKYEDYTGVQNTRFKSTGTKIEKKDDFNFNEALRRTGDAKTAANEYLAWCDENGYIPKFDTFARHENYYKMLEDFSTYDNGVSAQQGAVTMSFPKEGDAFGSMAQLIQEGLDEDAILEARREKMVPEIVNKVGEVLNKRKQFSLKTADAPVAQSISSAKTSIMQIPALFKHKDVVFGKTNIDIGGGRFDLAKDYLAERGTKSMIFDPYNRGAEENTETLSFLQSGKRADTATCANVLNVIAEPAARSNVVLEVAKAIKPDGTAYFMVYEGNGTGEGKQTSSGWQNNRKTADYVDEISEWFETVQRKGKLIIAKDPVKNLPKAAWEIQPGEAVMYSLKDRQYEEALDNGDISTVERLVKEAAQKAGYVQTVYHGTDAEFNAFDTRPKSDKRTDHTWYASYPKGTIFLTENKRAASAYGSNIKYLYLDTSDMKVFNRPNEYAVDVADHEVGHEVLKYPVVCIKGKDQTIYLTRYANRVKSSELVTYDDDGEIIPLSQRFRHARADLRYSLKDNDADRMEQELNSLRQQREDLQDEIDVAYLDDIPQSDINKLEARMAKLNAEIDKLVAQERKAAVKTSMNDILSNLSLYRRSDLESMAEQISDGNWDGYEDLTRTELEEALREEIDRLELSPLEMQSKRDGLYVRPVGKARFSLKDQEDLMRQNADLKTANSGLKDLFKSGKVVKMDKKSMTDFAKAILKENSSGADVNGIRDELNGLYDYLVSGENGKRADWDDAYKWAFDIATEVLESAVELNDTLWNEYSELRKELRTRGIKIDQTLSNDLMGYESLNDFRKANMGKIKLTNDGTPIDVVFNDLAARYPEFFNEDEHTHPADQLLRIADVLDSLKPTEYNPHTYTMRESATWLANDIMMRYYRLQNNKLVAAIERGKKNAAKERQRYMERRAEAVKKVKDKYGERMAKGREDRKARELREKITSRAGQISKKLLNGTDKSNVPEALRSSVASVMACINLESNYTYDPSTGSYKKNDDGLPTRRTEEFRRIKEQYEEIAANNEIGMVISPDLLGVPAEGIKSMLDKVIGLKDIRLADMNMSQLETVYDVVRVVEHSILTAGKTLSKMRWQTIDAAADSFQAVTATRKTKRTLTEKHKMLDIETPYTFFSHFGEAGHEFYRMLRNAQDKEQLMQDELKDRLANVVSLEDRQKAEKEIVEFVTRDGVKLTLSKAHIMNIYLLYNRQQARGHLLRGGIVQPKVGKIRKGTDAVLLTEMELLQMFKHIQKERAIADGLQKLTLRLAEWGNEASMTVYGIKKFKDPDYWTIHSSDIGINQNIEQGGNKPRSIANMGSAKSVIPEASNALDIDSVFEVFDRHASDMLCYSAWLAPMEDANRLFNYRFRDENWSTLGMPTMKGIINRVSGEGSTQYWMRLMEDIQNGLSAPADTATEQDVMKVIGNVKKASVSSNIRVIVQQPTAYARAAAVLSPDVMLASVAKDVTVKPMLDGWEKAIQYAPIAARKAAGGYEVSSNPKQLAELLYQPESKIGKAKQAAKEAPLWAAGMADQVTWGTIWNACEMQVHRDNKTLKKGSGAFYAAVADLFTEVIDQTQVVDGVLQRSQAMRSGSNFVKQMTSFTGEPTQAANMVIRAYDQMRYESDPKKRGKAIKKLGRAVSVYTFTAVLNAFAQSIIDAIRDDDDENEYWEKVWAAFRGINGNEKTWRDFARNVVLGGNLANNMNPMSWIPVWKDVLSVIQGYSVERMDAASMSDFFDSIGNVMKTLDGNGKYTTGYAALKALAAGAKLKGSSASNLLRDIEGIVRTIQVETGDLMGRYNTMKLMTKPKNNMTSYGKLLFDAYGSDREVYEEMYDDLIDSGVEPDAIQSKMETFMKKAQGVTSVKDLDQRFLPPAQQAEYDSMMGDLQQSTIWFRANDAQRDKVEGKVYEMIMDKADESTLDKISDGARYGIDETDYLLYQLALSVVDQPSESGKYGSYTVAERADAIKATDLSDEEMAYLWYSSQSGSEDKWSDEVFDALERGIDIETYLDFKSFESVTGADKDKNGNSISGSKKEKIRRYLNDNGVDRDTFNFIMYEVMGYKK